MLLQNYLIMSWVHLDDLKPYTAGNLFSFFLFYQNMFFFTAKIYARKSGFTYTIRRYSTLTQIVFLFLSFFLASTKILFVILKPIREKSVLNRDKNLNRNYHLKTQHLATQQ